MCRFAAYASWQPQTLVDVMGAPDLAEFVELSRLHSDGWGAAWLPSPDDSTDWQSDAKLLVDKGVRLTRLRSTLPGRSDPRFTDYAGTARGQAGLMHFRWASSGMAVNPANQHPFASFTSGDEAVFAHNGHIGWVPGLTQAGRRQWRSAGVEAPYWQGTTDSERYFWLIRGWHAAGASWPEAVIQACRKIRRLTRPCTINAVLMTAQEMIVVHAAAGMQPRFSEAELSRVAAAGLPRDHTESYYNVLTRRSPQQVVVASSGLSSQGWEQVPDETMLVINLATLTVDTHTITGQ